MQRTQPVTTQNRGLCVQVVDSFEVPVLAVRYALAESHAAGPEGGHGDEEAYAVEVHVRLPVRVTHPDARALRPHRQRVVA